MVSIKPKTATDSEITLAVISKYKHIPDNLLSPVHAAEIITQLSQQGVTEYVNLLNVLCTSGCNISKLVLTELENSVTCKARRSEFAREVKRRDNSTCWVTGFTLQTEAAHIIPFATCIIDTMKYDVNNGICLDRRVHGLWDAGEIICVPDLTEKTIRFEIRNEHNRDELIKMVPELANMSQLPVTSGEMLDYFKARYYIDRNIDKLFY